ncbi:MAG: hypothetical protein CMJ70_22840 [Planctomycetaceae bacterium]|nr:hypothetical protein [Planctomycetaceae bacterium]
MRPTGYGVIDDSRLQQVPGPVAAMPPVLPLDSDQPLSAELTRAITLEQHSDAVPGGQQKAGGPDGIWFDGSTLLCGCPECRAPMSIRLWLAVADCWQCETSIQLTEEQERQAHRLLQQHQSSRTAVGPSLAQPVVDSPAPHVPLPAEHVSKPLDPVVAGAPPAPVLPSPPRARRRRAAASTEAHRRLRPHTATALATAWLSELFTDLPSWLISLVFHLILLTILGLLTLGDLQDRMITLSTVVSRNVREGVAEFSLQQDEAQFQLPPPSEFDVNNQTDRQILLRAEQEARQLRVDSELLETTVPLEQVRQRVQGPRKSRLALASRDPRVRVQMIRQEGGTTLTEAAVARALHWLSRQQRRDGRWKLDGGRTSDSAATSLALMPFLGAGQTPDTGVYKNVVARGLRWLLDSQLPNGDLRINGSGNTGMYAQGQCAIVLCEAFLMTGNERLRIPAQQAINFIVAAQFPDGGWRYRPNQETPRPGRRGDTSVLGWQMMALQSARAAGLEVPEETLELASHYLDGVATRSGSQYAYQRGNAPTPVMTAEALLCRMYLGWSLREPGLRQGVDYLLSQHLPDARRENIYYWYYATQTLHQAGGTHWDRWNKQMRDVLVSSQVSRGKHAGSWQPAHSHSRAGGRVYTTALAACTLEVYYRHLPIFRQIDLDGEVDSQ